MTQKELYTCLKRLVQGERSPELEALVSALLSIPSQQRHLLLMLAQGWTPQELTKEYGLRNFERSLTRAEDAVVKKLEDSVLP